MSSDPAAIKKSMRTYLMVGLALFVFTGITVGVNQIHLASIALAITVAIIIAITKGSMVAAIFMHLSHEKKWIYGALILTVAFFVVLMLLPNLTVSDTIGTQSPYAAAAQRAAAKAEKAEKKWIYGALILTVAFFVVLMLLPNLTVGDTIGTQSPYAAAAQRAAAKAEKAEK